jgi:hypothetical protein
MIFCGLGGAAMAGSAHTEMVLNANNCKILRRIDLLLASGETGSRGRIETAASVDFCVRFLIDPRGHDPCAVAGICRGGLPHNACRSLPGTATSSATDSPLRTLH